MHGGFQGGPGGPGGYGGGGPPMGTPPPGYRPSGPHPMSVGADGYGTYEFNELESSVLAKTAARAKQWGVISAVIGGLQMVSSCGMVSSTKLGLLLPMGIVSLVVGVTFMGVASSLEAAARTRGNDIPHLMGAMQKLATAFQVQIICNIIGVVLFAAAMVVLFLAAIAEAAR